MENACSYGNFMYYSNIFSIQLWLTFLWSKSSEYFLKCAIYRQESLLSLKRKECWHVLNMEKTWGILLSETRQSHKTQILSDSTYMRYLEWSELQKQKVEWWLPGAGGKRYWGTGVRISVWKDENRCRDG